MNARPQDIAVHRATTAATATERNRAAAALHTPNDKRRTKCTECGHPWPCRTARVLRGER
jgi:hypothetical protein